MDNWNDIKLALSLAEHKTMAAAAKHLKINVATVSRRIHQLQENFESPIFHKSNNSWTLTKEGFELIRLAGDFSSGLSKLHVQDNIFLERKVEVRINASKFVIEDILPARVFEFFKEHPNIVLSLISSGNRVSLAYSEADISIRLERPTEGRLIGKRISTINMSPIQNIHSNSSDWIGLTKNWDTLPEVSMAKNHFGREPVMHAPTYRALFELVKSTGFSGVGPTFMCKDYPDIEPRLDVDEMQICDVWIVYHQTRKKDPAIRAVVSWLEKIFPSTGL